MIKLESVTKIFPGSKVPAVDNLNLGVAEGEVCVIVGPSGCGKTTTMKMINRLHNPTKGNIFVNGKNIMELNPIELRLGIGYVIQEIGLFPHMTIEENIATVPRELKWPRDKTKKRVEELMRLMGLDPGIYAKRRPSALSGGQRQRVGVARAMAADPPVLLMDEPFGAVDPITRARLQNEFLRLQQKMKKTIVFITHDIDEAIKMGDKIAAMREGKLIQFGNPDELLSSPKDEFVSKLVGHNRSIKRLHLLEAETAVQESVPVARMTDSVGEIAGKLDTTIMDSIIVVDEDCQLKGAISANALTKDKNALAGDLVQELANTAGIDATLNDVLSIMLNLGEGYVAVVDEQERFRGIITLNDILEVVRSDTKPTE
ncbi:ABC transporter ATP-binding protein [Dethiobacter alkaliphilus]|uniref:Quaternary amine transport ATP-binding protein n=1 Tax=Dethiobacter alkaliphilus AHT 1 TaxID=555088 RepID=C0GK33_DETAL|nr:ABC transporter ATP-binding protein [Dethiobacter alkaliphilus]EEG76303.1 glycine betaine/L-proline ABC transporter, ATPase subunit [Dethiobacter alkaliphilus AHT 1]